jgi:hypothetical protein
MVFAGEVGAQHLPPIPAPAGAPLDALEVTTCPGHEADRWRTGAFRELAASQLGDLRRLDAATGAYADHLRVGDPADLSHLQLVWATASALAARTPSVVLDVLAATWHPGAAVAQRAADRPFAVTAEISVIFERESTPRFGHAVHTRGMAKFARPDLIAGVPADQVHDTTRILNHLAARLADGHTLTPGQRLRFDGRRTLVVTPYEPGGPIPDVNLAADGLLLVDA